MAPLKEQIDWLILQEDSLFVVLRAYIGRRALVIGKLF